AHSLIEGGGALHFARDHLLHSLKRTAHSPALPLLQLARAASRAASRSLREAAPTYFPFSVVAKAPHAPRPVRVTTSQPLAPHALSATSSARCIVGWFQLQPRRPDCRSQAIAP